MASTKPTITVDVRMRRVEDVGEPEVMTLKTGKLKPKAVDREKRLLRGVSVIEQGEAKGHPFDVSADTVKDVVRLGQNAAKGIKVRFAHPDACSDGIGTALGRATNFRSTEDGERALADVHILEAASKSPRGDLGAYIMELADEAPDLFGMSIAAEGRLERDLDQDGDPATDDDGNIIRPRLRVQQLNGVDVVDSPAANTAGLFGTSLAAKATTLLELAIEAAEPPEIADEHWLQAIAETPALRPMIETRRLQLNDSTIQISLEEDAGADRAAAFLNRFLDGRGIEHTEFQGRHIVELLDRRTTMPDKPKAQSQVGETLETPAPAPTAPAAPEPNLALEAAQAENTRLTGINAIGAMFPNYDLAETLATCAADLDCTVDKARDLAMKRMAELDRANTPAAGGTRVEMGGTALEKFLKAAETAICLRTGILPANETIELDDDARAITPQMLARECLRLNGQPNAHTMHIEKVWEHALQLSSGVGHTSSDFTNILANVGNKAVLSGWNMSPTTWDRWCRIGNLADFKTAKRLRFSEAPYLEERAEGAPARAGTFEERGEDIYLTNYAKAFSYTRQMFRNDDAGVFADLGSRMGAMAAQTLERQVYVLLTSNSGNGPTLSDSVALFNSGSHYNVGTQGVVSQTTIAEAVAGMMVQRGLGEDGTTVTLNCPPVWTLSGPSRAMEIERIVKSPYWGESSRRDPQNTKVAMLDPLYVPQLELLKPYAYYFVASPATAPTCEVAFLDGIQTPRTTRKDGTLIDGTTIVVDLDWGIAFTGGYEGIYKNDGSSA